MLRGRVAYPQQLTALRLPASLEHPVVHGDQVLLLWSQDGAGSRDSDPPSERGRREPEVLHAVEGDQGACAAQAGLAVDGDGALLRFCMLQKLLDNVVGRGRTVEEVEV